MSLYDDDDEVHEFIPANLPKLKVGHWVKTVCMYITKEQKKKSKSWSLGHFHD